MLYITRFKKRVIYNNMEKFHGNLPKLQPVQNTDPMNCTVWSVHQTLFVGNPKELWQPKRGIQMVLLVFEEEQDSKQVVV